MSRISEVLSKVYEAKVGQVTSQFLAKLGKLEDEKDKRNRAFYSKNPTWVNNNPFHGSDSEMTSRPEYKEFSEIEGKYYRDLKSLLKSSAAKFVKDATEVLKSGNVPSDIKKKAAYLFEIHSLLGSDVGMKDKDIEPIQDLVSDLAANKTAKYKV